MSQIFKFHTCDPPATDCDFFDGIVSVSLVHASCSGVVLSSKMDPHLSGTHHLLKDGGVVEIIIAWPHVWLWAQ